MDMKAIEIEIGGGGCDYDTVYLPFEENLNDANMYLDEFETEHDAFMALKEKWEAKTWGYHGDCELIRLVDIYPSEEALEQYIKLGDEL